MNLTFSLPIAVISGMLIFSRLAAILWTLPVWSIPAIPRRWKLNFCLLTTLLLLPVVPETWTSLPYSLHEWQLALLIGNEILLGLIIGLMVRLFLEVIALGGALIDRDLGYGMTNMFSPGAMEEQTISSLLFMQGFFLIFLISNSHLTLFKIVTASFFQIGPGHFRIDEHVFQQITSITTQMFILAFQFSLPIFSLILMINVALSLITRFAHEFEVMMLSFPLRLGLGLLVLIGATPVLLGIGHDLIYYLEENMLKLFLR